MQKTILFVALFIVVTIAGFFSCRNVDKDISTQEYLHDAPNLANQNHGFYSKVGHVDIVATEDGNQKLMTIGFSDSDIAPYEIKLYLGKETKPVDLKSGKYEVLFLRSALVLNNPVTGDRIEFVVKNDGFEAMKKTLPDGYISSGATEAIGIAVYGNHEKKSVDTDLVETCATSGGPGSTSCSNTCCSVSCSTGYYASCQSSCSCVKSSGH